MAREKKKGQDIVSQYLRLQQGDAKRQKTDRRPFLATECKDLGECERYRLQIISEIVQKVKEIQNAALGEFRIRELNDEINKLVREKGHWQRQIKTLGGPDHFLAEPGVPDGQRPKGSGGYAYFGAAKNLPGVRELFEVETQGPVKRTRGDLYKAITPDYYGFRDDDDGLLQRVEKKAEAKARGKLIKSVKEARAATGLETYTHDIPLDEHAALINVPTEADVEKNMLEARKKQLFHRYGIAPTDLVAFDKQAEKSAVQNATQDDEAEPVFAGPERRPDSSSPAPAPVVPAKE